MPQMAPMWWTMIMIMTFSFIMMMISMNYFSTTKMMIKNKFKINNNKMLWKW